MIVVSESYSALGIVDTSSRLRGNNIAGQSGGGYLSPRLPHHSRANGEGFIRYESTINGESYFAGKEATRRRFVWWTIIGIEEG